MIKIRSLIFCLILYTSLSCNQNLNSKENIVEKNETELLNDLFKVLTEPIPPFSPEDTTSTATENFNVKYEAWASEKMFDLYIRDSLFLPDKHFYRPINLNSSLDSLYNDLYQDKSLKSRKLNLNLLPKRPNFVLIPINPDPSSDTLYDRIKNGKKFMGFIEFSRIKFNISFSKACFYFARHMGPTSGGGEIIFAEKRKNKWTILIRKQIWVS